MQRRILGTVAIAAVASLSVTSTMAAQQQDTTRRDTTRAQQQQRDTARVQQQNQQQIQQQQQDPLVRRTEAGAVVGVRTAGGVDNRGLERSEVRQLQRALRDMGCNPGPVDGLLGPLTRRGIECARQRHGIVGDDLNEVLRAMNLSFTADEDQQGQQLQRDQQQRDTTPQQQPQVRDTTLQQQRPPTEPLARDTTQRPPPPR